MSTERELEVWQRVAGLAQSSSHDVHHIKRVQAFADGLGQVLGVDTDLVRVAAILHDLGRGDETRRHGLRSIEASSELATTVLRHIDMPDEAKKAVLDAIESHDQPDLMPPTVAGRILKDADFLAGFGAWGILRIAMWYGETGRRVDQVLQAMTEGMERRLRSLEFQVSRDAARREFLVARQFCSELERPVQVTANARIGFYCVIEGISGVGKTSAAQVVAAALARRGTAHLIVEEPSDMFRKLRESVGDELARDNVSIRRALLIADRADQAQRVTAPALSEGKTVISVRSYLSTAVYQSTDRASAYRVMLDHDWMPTCDLLVLLDLDADTALSRIKGRHKKAGDFESREYLLRHRELYKQLASAFPARATTILDASEPADSVTQKILLAIDDEVARQARQ